MARLAGAGWWRPDALLREAGANLWARRGRYGLLAGMVAAVISSLLWMELAAARDAINARRDFIVAGGTVVIVDRDQGRLDAVTCSALSHQPYVVAAGGLRHGETVYFDHAPGTPFQSLHIVGDLLPVIDPGTPAPSLGGIVLPVAASAELGAAAGSELGLHGRTERISAVVEPEPRTPTIGRSVLFPQATTGVVDQCWVEFRDGAYHDGVTTLPAWFAVEELSISPLIERNAGTRDLAVEWSRRPARLAWAAAGALVAAFAVLFAWRRRTELALYVVLGTSRPVAAALQTVEQTGVVLAGGLLGLLWGTAATSVTGDVDGEALRHGLRAVLLALALALAALPASASWLVRVNLVAMLKERPG